MFSGVLGQFIRANEWLINIVMALNVTDALGPLGIIGVTDARYV